MKLCLKILAIAIIAATSYSILGCSAPATFSYQNVSINITTYCSDCPGPYYNPAYPQPPNPGSVIMMPNTGEGGTETFFANVTNAPQTNVTWTVYPTPNLGGIDILPTGTALPIGESGTLGTINAAGGNSIYYTVPGPPVYGGAALEQANAMGIPQGDVLLVATVPDDPSNPSAVATGSQLIQVYAGSSAQGPPSTYLTPHTSTTPAGITSPAVTVARGTSFQFYGGTVGAAPCTTTVSCGSLPLYTADNTSVWAVGTAPYSLATAVIGGNTTLGTITQSGLYTAPATIPSPLPVVIIYSHLTGAAATYANIGVN